ncbi:alanine dehydrogenase [Oceanobacillus oncorhynchi subsp. incaldanensis]|uniref:Alanine dehydrogenase n=1 Tax=Oceanobacillus aidingensis TaxID=645964 RepID=A0ABV9JYL4_9BACI|nr:NAD(P)-dependent oxidoreductase [Oceanobacillus oncorhynchi]MDM8099895.1 NAD(P)-dependent oxidoreductase [Oceanobacillus oncorhynchi]UUI40433.1 alanine dehydrogenase [Oceanobacillus oncorhynchi]GIO18636.1 alanine dehydrogenase [Oceanobacillus oncorhynchi subsp. incaldanensis]
MIFGVLKDNKIGEYRVVLTPVEAAAIKEDGHTVLVQKDAGFSAGFTNEQYEQEGAEMVDTIEEMYKRCDFLAKVKEIEESEYGLLRENQIVYTCIHPAAHPEQVQAILDSKSVAFTAEDSHRFGSVNCEAAGKQGALMGLNAMLTINGGKGKFVSGLAGAPGMKVLILGGGLVGRSSLQVLQSLGAWCTVMDVNYGVLRDIGRTYNEKVNTQLSTKQNIKKLLPEIDMVINCVKWPKENKDYLIDREMLHLMEKGSVIVDISNDEDGAIESFRETTHEDPMYVENGVVHYCVSNIPGAIANSTSVAYAASVLPHIRSILNHGVKEACIRDGFLRRSLTAYKGYLTHEETSAIQNRPWARPEDVLQLQEEEIDFAPPATRTRSTNFLKI